MMIIFNLQSRRLNKLLKGTQLVRASRERLISTPTYTVPCPWTLAYIAIIFCHLKREMLAYCFFYLHLFRHLRVSASLHFLQSTGIYFPSKCLCTALAHFSVSLMVGKHADIVPVINPLPAIYALQLFPCFIILLWWFRTEKLYFLCLLIFSAETIPINFILRKFSSLPMQVNVFSYFLSGVLWVPFPHSISSSVWKLLLIFFSKGLSRSTWISWITHDLFHHTCYLDSLLWNCHTWYLARPLRAAHP